LQQLEVNPQADTELKTKKQKKPEESSSLSVSESPADYNQLELEEKTSQADESKESSHLSLSSNKEPYCISESTSNSPSEPLDSTEVLKESNSDSLDESLLGLVESDKITGEPISNSLSEPPEEKESTIEGQSDSPPKQTLVLCDNEPKTPTDNSESLSESLSSSQSTKEIQNSNAIPDSLSGAALARRLDVSPSTLRHKKTARNFGKWTLGHDPDGIAWHYDGKKFIPQQQE
jgi:hypothetical protein